MSGRFVVSGDEGRPFRRKPSLRRYVAQDTDQDEVIENGTNGDFKTTIVLEPIGVVGAITPWCARERVRVGVSGRGSILSDYE